MDCRSKQALSMSALNSYIWRQNKFQIMRVEIDPSHNSGILIEDNKDIQIESK